MKPTKKKIRQRKNIKKIQKYWLAFFFIKLAAAECCVFAY